MILVWELSVPLDECLEAEEVSELTAACGLGSCFLLEEDPHVVDLDDLLGVDLGDLQATRHTFEQALLLEPRERLPDGCPGDAETLRQCHFPQRGPRLMDAGENLVAQGGEDGVPVRAG